jgi:subtilase family serine protease
MLWVQEVGDADNPDDTWGRIYHTTFDGSAWSTPELVLEAMGVEGLVLLNDPQDNLMAVWRGVSDEVSDLYRMVYDQVDGSWSQPLSLTQDRDVEWAYDAVYDDLNDRVFLVAMEREVGTEVVMIDAGLAGLSDQDAVRLDATELLETVPVTVPTFGASNMVQLVYTPAPDLAITAGDIGLSPSNPQPGTTATVSATVHNQGDLAAAVTVSFYDGDPDAGGTLIDTAALGSTLAGGLTETLTVQWPVPAAVAAHTLYVRVDPADAVAESDEDNNEAQLNVVLPDLTVAYGYSDFTEGHGMTLTAQIANDGASGASSAQVTFRRDGITGTLLGQTTVPALSPGQRESVSVLWDVESDEPVSHDIWIIVDDSAETVAEADETNNVGFIWGDILPDLTLSATDITGTGPVSIILHNNGTVAATDVTLALYQDAIDGTVIYSDTVGTIGAHAAKTVELPVPNGEYALYVEIDPADAVPEMDESNNAAVRPLVVRRELYMPLIIRAGN